jgi:DNA-binding SARP family transcriptional activator/predicted ATPase
MAAVLQLAFLGGFRAVIEDTALAPPRTEPITDFSSTKSQALLAYLACTRRRHTRDALAAMFWGEFDDEAAKTSLRQSLANLKKLVGTHLLIERDAVEFDAHAPYMLDVVDFERDAHGDAEARNRAVASYAGDLLKGLVVKNAPEFEEWLVVERERLRQLAAGTLRLLARDEERAGDAGAAAGHLRALIALDSLDEPAQRHLMLLLARNGQRAAALAQYETLARALQTELGVPPEAETTRLRDRIQHAAHAIQLPAEPAPLIGRENELATLRRRLADPGCRLITLVGLGGVGKTRLALDVARDSATRFLHGAFFVSLASVQDKAGLIVLALAALNARPEGDTADVAQLVKLLSDKEMLLVFDNAEHVVAPCAEVIATILKAAPEVKCIVTSRERLNLRSEWVLAIDGLPSGDGASAGVKLFQQTALRAGCEVAMQPALVRVCQRLRGLPLALELAAPWARVMEVEQIEDELVRSLDLLNSTMRDVDERHRSLRAVFDHSWRMLSPDESRALAALSVFRGGFTAEAARSVAGATPAILSHLIDQSWLQQPALARFDLHELVRQYAQEHLAVDVQVAVLHRHADYYAGWLAAREAMRRSRRQKQVARDLQAEMDNVRLMWQTAVKLADAAIFDKAVACVFWICDMLGWYREAMGMFDAAVESLGSRPEHGAMRGRLLLRKGVLARLIGHYDEAEALLTEAETHLRDSGDVRNYAYVLCQLGVFPVVRGDIDAGVQRFEASLALYREINDLQGISDALVSTSIAESRRGNYARAAQLQQESVDILTELGDEMELAVALNNLGDTEYFRGRLDQALAHQRAAIDIQRRHNDRRNLAISLNNASNILCDMEKWGEGLAMAQECTDIFRDMDSRDGLMNGLHSIAGALLGQGDVAGATRHFREALSIALQINAEAEAMNLMVLGAKLLIAQGREADAAQLLHSILKHPATTAYSANAAKALVRDVNAASTATPWTLKQMVDGLAADAGESLQR